MTASLCSRARLRTDHRIDVVPEDGWPKQLWCWTCWEEFRFDLRTIQASGYDPMVMRWLWGWPC